MDNEVIAHVITLFTHNDLLGLLLFHAHFFFFLPPMCYGICRLSSKNWVYFEKTLTPGSFLLSLQLKQEIYRSPISFI